MTDYEYIYQQMKKAHYSGWDDEELRKCVDMLPTLSRDEQFAMYRSKWIGTEKTLKDIIGILAFIVIYNLYRYYHEDNDNDYSPVTTTTPESNHICL